MGAVWFDATPPPGPVDDKLQGPRRTAGDRRSHWSLITTEAARFSRFLDDAPQVVNGARVGILHRLLRCVHRGPLVLCSAKMMQQKARRKHVHNLRERGRACGMCLLSVWSVHEEVDDAGGHRSGRVRISTRSPSTVAIRTVSDVMAARCGDYGVGPVGRHVISDEPARTVGHDNRRFLQIMEGEWHDGQLPVTVTGLRETDGRETGEPAQPRFLLFVVV